MVFHLDKCLGCSTCSIACKNTWTDREGAQYMWWNNVETKPGTGYPAQWEDQERFKGGWEKKGHRLRVKIHHRLGGLFNLFYNPFMPTMDDYYEPWTYNYGDLFGAPAGEDQPTARPISMITRKPIEIESGPNWDDDLSGSPIYAANDPNLKTLSQEERRQLFELERLVFFHLPRICNHCLNPACITSCPAGAIYKRGEDGIVLNSQEKCRGWRMCITSCPYKKSYYNLQTGKSEKCILCYPLIETGQAPLCFHSCVGRIRYLGVLFYDADQIENAANGSNEKLVYLHREIILDPFDRGVVRKAREAGIDEIMIESAQKSPVYKFVKRFRLALPLHPEFRTLPMLFYVPPLLPILGSTHNGIYEVVDRFLSSLEEARIPIRYMASLFAAENESVVAEAYMKLIAVRIYKRFQTVGDISEKELNQAMEFGNTTPDEAEEIFRLTSLSSFEERFVISPAKRDTVLDAMIEPNAYRSVAGLGIRRRPVRKW